jgi:hypothetical protein
MVIYKQLISSIRVFLKEFDFNKQGENFILKRGHNRGIINFQKSRNSSANHIFFTINIGVYLNSLSLFNNIDMLNEPIIDGCQWKDRVNPISLQKKESWWQIDENTSFENINSKVINALKESALPQIEKFIIDENLEKAWLSGISGGLSEQQKQLYLIAILKNDNRENWQNLVEQLRKYSKGKSFENNIQENIAKLGIKNE